MPQQIVTHISNTQTHIKKKQISMKCNGELHSYTSCVLSHHVSNWDVQRVRHDNRHYGTQWNFHKWQWGQKCARILSYKQQSVKWWETWFQLIRRDLKSLGSILGDCITCELFLLRLANIRINSQTDRDRERATKNERELFEYQQRNRQQNEIKSELHWPR